MTRMLFRLAFAVALLGIGWSARAQTTVADFELTVDAPSGETVINCAKGCNFTHDVGLTETEARANTPHTQFSFRCNAPRCRATINGAGHVMR